MNIINSAPSSSGDQPIVSNNSPAAATKSNAAMATPTAASSRTCKSVTKVSTGDIAVLEKRINELECEQLMNRLKLRASKLMHANTMTCNEDKLFPSSLMGMQPSSSSGKRLATTPGLIKSGYDIINQAEVIKVVQ